MTLKVLFNHFANKVISFQITSHNAFANITTNGVVKSRIVQLGHAIGPRPLLFVGLLLIKQHATITQPYL